MIHSSILRESTDIVAAVRDAVRVHNATPHPGTGMSPFFFLFGYEPVFPGWQSLSHSVNTETARLTRDQMRVRRALLEKLAGESRATESRDDIVVGEWVVYPLSAYEQSCTLHPASSSRAMCPEMSLPSKVVEVRKESLTVAVMGSPQRRRDVSRSVCRVLTVDVPPTLQRLAMDVIRYEIDRKSVV